MCRIIKPFITGLLLLVVASPSPAWAFAFNINVNTTPLAGTAATLGFDFINGDGAVNNTLHIGNFLTDGIFNPNFALITGDVSGSFDSTLTFSDNDFFNELLQPITLGNVVQFRLDTSNVFASGGTFPDSFALFILDSNGLPLVTTTDPTGADALFALDLTGAGSGNLSVFASTSTQPSWSVLPIQTVPEPGGLGLMLIGGWSVYRRKNRSNKP